MKTLSSRCVAWQKRKYSPASLQHETDSINPMEAANCSSRGHSHRALFNE